MNHTKILLGSRLQSKKNMADQRSKRAGEIIYKFGSTNMDYPFCGDTSGVWLLLGKMKHKKNENQELPAAFIFYLPQSCFLANISYGNHLSQFLESPEKIVNTLIIFIIFVRYSIFLISKSDQNILKIQSQPYYSTQGQTIELCVQ